uniref:Integrase catalytic domain-containing protein n=1 Tax=Globodera rostochiensis TaxID=31243 RepID=A0A914HDQ6_GLORO
MLIPFTVHNYAFAHNQIKDAKAQINTYPQSEEKRSEEEKLELKSDAIPTYCRPRPVPYNTRLVVEAELDRLLEQNVIRPVDHTRWAAPIVVVKKASGATRVCADFSTGLNNALLLHQHPLPLPEDIFSKLNGGQVFAQIDLKDAYLQVELKEKSKELCTIATHRGNFRYERLPFGVKSAPGIFQCIMDSMLKAIAHASCSLTAAEKNYAQIEKEGLAEIFAVKKFHKYIFGRHFTLQTDHKPLLAIFGNKKWHQSMYGQPLAALGINFAGNDFDIEYQNTADFGQEDALSRLIAKAPVPEEDEFIVASITDELGAVQPVMTQLPLVHADLVKAAKEDEVIKEVQKCIRTQWPMKKDMAPNIIPFHRRRDALSMEDGCLLYAERVVVPISLQNEVDNGTQFTSHEFRKFAKENGINHLFSAPYNPMSNGQAERFVDTFKRTFRKLRKEGATEIVDTFLATYRMTPNESLVEKKSPAEAFLLRKPRTTLDLLRAKPKLPVVRDEAMERQFNRRHGARPRTFRLGAKVFARHRLSQPWRAGTISRGKGVIYDVQFPDSSVNRFHANQIWPVRRKIGTPPRDETVEAIIAALAAEIPNRGRPDRVPIADRVQIEHPKRHRRPPDRFSPGR